MERGSAFKFQVMLGASTASESQEPCMEAECMARDASMQHCIEKLPLRYAGWPVNVEAW